MIIMLGGGIRREMAAAQLAQIHPSLPVIISSGSTLPCLYRVFVKEAGVDWRRVTIDFRAVDTLTNFTANEESWGKTLIDSLRAIGWLALGNRMVDHLYHSPTYVETQKQLRSSRCELGEATLPDFNSGPICPSEWNNQ